MTGTASCRVKRNSNVGAGAVSIINAGLVVNSLHASRASGRVLCLFERSAYLQFSDQLVCLALYELGTSPITVQLPKELMTLPACVYVDAGVHFDTSGLVFENGQVLNLLSANEHSERIHTIPSRSDWTDCVVNLRTQLPLPHEGMARLFIENTIDNFLLNYAAPAVDSLLQQISAFCARPLDEKVNVQFDTQPLIKLLGVGPGLTPSGDDFIMGVFACLHLLKQEACVRRLWSALRDETSQKTTIVSCALLELAANNQHSEHMQSLIALLVRYPQSSQRSIAHAIQRIGNTSGWDWFTGFSLCLEAVTRVNNSTAPMNWSRRMACSV